MKTQILSDEYFGFTPQGVQYSKGLFIRPPQNKVWIPPTVLWKSGSPLKINKNQICRWLWLARKINCELSVNITESVEFIGYTVVTQWTGSLSAILNYNLSPYLYDGENSIQNLLPAYRFEILKSGIAWESDNRKYNGTIISTTNSDPPVTTQDTLNLNLDMVGFIFTDLLSKKVNYYPSIFCSIGTDSGINITSGNAQYSYFSGPTPPTKFFPNKIIGSGSLDDIEFDMYCAGDQNYPGTVLTISTTGSVSVKLNTTEIWTG